MWEAIRSNRRRSVVLIWTMAAVLVGLGAAVGASIHPDAWPLGVAAALVVWGVLYAVAALAGDRIVLSVAGAKKLEKADAPQLFNVVEEMVIASGLGRMPDIYLIPDDRPNAFAAGRKPETRVLAVTSGLLRLMDRDELQGVVAHEIGHHQNADVRFMILAGVMMGAIVLIGEIFLRSMFYSRGGRSSRRSGGDGGHAVILIAALLFAILAPLAARMLYFACSRRREYLADASAARYTRYPEGLASALEKISGHYTTRQQTSKILAPMYIVNPMEALAAVGLFSTHPPVPDRCRILRSMGGGAGYKAYEEAYRKVNGKTVIGARTLAQDTPVATRGPSAEPSADRRAQAVQRSKEAHDLLARVAHLISLMCACGVTIRVPEGFKRDAVDCPRCGRSNAVPKADAAPATAPDAPLRYQRQGGGWESFKCACGAAVQLSPAFAASFVRCEKCGRRIEVQGPAS